MLTKKGKQYHHKHVQIQWADKALTYYESMDEANASNPGDSCYILHSTSDNIWFVCCGTLPLDVYTDTKEDLDKWYRGVDVKGRISQSSVE